MSSSSAAPGPDMPNHDPALPPLLVEEDVAEHEEQELSVDALTLVAGGGPSARGLGLNPGRINLG